MYKLNIKPLSPAKTDHPSRNHFFSNIFHTDHKHWKFYTKWWENVSKEGQHKWDMDNECSKSLKYNLLPRYTLLWQWWRTFTHNTGCRINPREILFRFSCLSVLKLKYMLHRSKNITCKLLTWINSKTCDLLPQTRDIISLIQSYWH